MRRHSLGERLYNGDSTEPVTTNPFVSDKNHANGTHQLETDSNTPIQLQTLGDQNLRKRLSQASKQSEALDILVQRTKKDEAKEHFQQEWRFAARVLNRLFMWIVLILVVFNCLVVLFSAPRENLD